MWAIFRRSGLRTDERLRLEALERRLKVIEADWDEWYDKFRRLYARLSKRVEREEKTAEDAPGPTNGKEEAPHINPLAEAILRGSRGGQ